MNKWEFRISVVVILMLCWATLFWHSMYQSEKEKVKQMDLKIRFLREEVGEPVENAIQKWHNIRSDVKYGEQ